MYIIGLDYLLPAKSRSLLEQLRKRGMVLAEELEQSNVVIYVLSEADPEKKLRNKAIEMDVPIIPLLPYMDTILGNMVMGG